MTCSPKLVLKKYFGSASIQKMEMTLEESKSHLEYFWSQDKSGNSVIVSIDGQRISSYDELVSTVNQDRYKDAAVVEVGLFLSNDGKKSIWPDRP